jgi:hypothetical protein
MRTDEKKKEVKKPLTEAELKALRDAKAAARKIDIERALLLEKALPKMSQRQLRGVLRDKANDGGPGLTAAFGVVLGIVLDNTKTRENPFAKLASYPR